MPRHNMTEAELARVDLAAIEKADRRHQRRSRWTALAFMSPALLLVGGMLLYPVFYNIWISFTKWRKFRGFDEWAGFGQYERLFANPNFETAVQNTFIWVIVSLVLPVALGLFIAVLLRGQRFEEVAKSIFFLPRVLAPTAIGVLWFYVYAPDGMLNAVLGLFSSQPVDIGWLYDDATVTGSVVVAYLWQTVGLAMVLLLLGLAALPSDPLEAAAVEGATAWQTFRHVTLPLLLPTILVVVILSVLAGFTVFDHIWVMAKDYPGKRTLSLTVYMYVEAFEKSSWAYASAIAVILGLVVLSVTWAQVILQDRIERLTK
ncbi:carbohydrate ABC transporter permease [Mameliella sediminis]|uniref:carbohydrate ABC transporter permease n=1 Tax=Mameliella sediminis TaxID=2836866 RepID=UPI001C489E80|nr:sugar ABC transporter permease [Mameliella sediminis]MBY6115559.1 sugar ABC transporter permease [Antarctobacter heliothermus]MBY6145806.1 sugar ABC transporter permease [Mameliella alba]MBV7393472.1 sugar ABC transporter permease [Mameliella sediminis]MBY6161128.1 sugar ABC transporter permease [Mameliella alba]MBY6169598.1 sugar ABC transporter permease [Mameliella alba]